MAVVNCMVNIRMLAPLCAPLALLLRFIMYIRTTAMGWWSAQQQLFFALT